MQDRYIHGFRGAGAYKPPGRHRQADRRFDGKIYSYKATAYTKKRSDQRKRELQRAGNLVRVTRPFGKGNMIRFLFVRRRSRR